MSRKEELKQEAAAWRNLAEWCVEHGEYLCNATKYWGQMGSYYGSKGVTVAPFPAPWLDMCDRIKPHAIIGTYDEARDTWLTSGVPFDCVANNHPRVMFCLLMALECEAEAKEVPRRKH